MILAGDIGGTNTRLALFEEKGDLEIQQELKYPSQKHKSLEEIIQLYIEEKKQKISAACFGIAGPVFDGKCRTTNLSWIVDIKNLIQTLKIDRVSLLNDLEASANGICALKPADLFTLQTGKKQHGNRAVIAAGTGLGEAGLIWNGKEHHSFSCEGGHADFAPRNDLEIELFRFLQKKFRHVSYERVVSGPGIYSIYQFLTESRLEQTNPEIEQEMKKKNPTAVICEYGIENRDNACRKSLDLFLSLYGAEAGNLSLKLLCLGGVYITGGIAPRLLKLLAKSSFVASFKEKGRFQELLESIPVQVILNDNVGLLGAAAFAKQML